MKKKFDSDRNNPRISSATVTNFQLTLASAKENFPILNDLLGPVEPEILTFYICSSSLSGNQHGAERSLLTAKVGRRLAFCCINIDKMAHTLLLLDLYTRVFVLPR